MYRICRFEVNKHSRRVIYSQCYDFVYTRLQSAKDKLKELSGVESRDILACLNGDTLRHFYNEFCDGNAQFAFWTIGKTKKGPITGTAEYYSEWFIYTTDKQRYLYEEPVTDLRRYRAMINADEWGFNPYEK